MTPYEALKIAITRSNTQESMAKVCRVSQGSVSKWLNQTKRLPAEHVLKVEKATGVSRHDLRPDIYPRPLTSDYDPDLTPWDTGDYGAGRAPSVEQVAS